MKDKPNEWVAISDLMAGVLAVVMLMLAVVVLQRQFAEAQHQRDLAALDAATGNPVAELLQQVQETLGTQGAGHLISVDVASRRITLRDGVFAQGSACVTPAASAAMQAVEAQVGTFLRDHPAGRIFVEGYTDDAPVKRPVTDFARFCTVYDDNFTLSAARAREARKTLLGTLDATSARRIVVAGYGDSRPLAEVPPSDPRNRRVEVFFTLDGGRS